MISIFSDGRVRQNNKMQIMTGGISALAVTHADGKIPSHNGFITAEVKSLGATDAHMCTVVEGLGVELGINIMEKLKIREDIPIEAEFQFFF
ncbi:hypothetical protein M5689_019342 [Euphorbia peplus]|nr:hypothetical protein M5689_019342 [Euphorbia peplus]